MKKQKKMPERENREVCLSQVMLVVITVPPFAGTRARLGITLLSS